MASSININQNNNVVTLQDNNGSLSITDNNAGTTINVTQPVTNVVSVASIGPQGPVGPIPSSGAFTGSFSGSFTGSLFGTASYALTSSLALSASTLYATDNSPYGLVFANAQGSTPLYTSPFSAFFNASTGHINAIAFSGSFNGNLTGTASSAQNAITSSYSTALGATLSQPSAGVLQLRNSANQTISSLSLLSAATAISSSFALTASFVQNAVSASYITGSIFTDTNPALSASYALTSSFATTSSFITTKTVFNQPILGTGNIGFVTRSFSQSIGTNATGETQLLQIPIPANTFSATDKLSFFATFSKTGSAFATTVRVKLSTSSSMPSGNTSTVAFFTSGATAQFIKLNRDMSINAGNLKGFPFITSATTDQSATTSTAAITVAFDVTQIQYLYVSAQPSTSTTDITYLEAFEIKNT